MVYAQIGAVGGKQRGSVGVCYHGYTSQQLSKYMYWESSYVHNMWSLGSSIISFEINVFYLLSISFY